MIDFVITSTVAIVAGIIVWFLTSRFALLRREAEKLKETRKEVYLAILKPHIEVLSSVKKPKDPKSQKTLNSIIQKMNSVDYRMQWTELKLIGSDEVVKALNNLMQSAYASNDPQIEQKGIEFLKLWGTLLLAIRKDLNTTGKRFKTKLSNTDMLRDIINDLDQYID